jgi:hypothetical protein
MVALTKLCAINGYSSRVSRLYYNCQQNKDKQSTPLKCLERAWKTTAEMQIPKRLAIRMLVERLFFAKQGVAAVDWM